MKNCRYINLLVFTLVLIVIMEGMTSQKKPLAALLAEKRDNRRVVLLFGRDGDPAQPLLAEQQEQFTRYASGMTERDIDVIVVGASTLTEPDRRFLLAAPYKLDPTRAFQGWLIGKDGGIKDRFDSPVAPRDLFREVDRMPMRRQEMNINKPTRRFL